MENFGQCGGEVPVPGGDAPLAAAVLDRVEVENHSLRPYEPAVGVVGSPEVGVHEQGAAQGGGGHFQPGEQGGPEGDLAEDQHLQGDGHEQNDHVAPEHDGGRGQDGEAVHGPPLQPQGHRHHAADEGEGVGQRAAHVEGQVEGYGHQQVQSPLEADLDGIILLTAG